MSGFVALHREAFAHPLLKDAARFRAWFWLVAHAAWKPTKHDARGHTIIVERGQLCAGREYLAKEWGWSPSAVERFLARLETEQMIERMSGQMKTVITICNYDKYQDAPEEAGHMSGQETGQKPDRNRTAKEQGNKETREPIGSHTPHSPPSGIRDDVVVPLPAKGAGRRKAAAKPVCDRPCDVSPQVWNDFVSMRIRMGAPVSETAITGFRREADRVGWPLERAISECVLRGWRGFKADWVKSDDQRIQNYRASGFQGPDRRSALARAIDEGIEHLRT